tara:strand:- start:120 stop:908 length:789 start_codon:yes stop_codon:yes gene_type:complete
MTFLIKVIKLVWPSQTKTDQLYTNMNSKVNQTIIKTILINTFFFICSSTNISSVQAEEQKLNVGFVTGFSEKGTYVGLSKTIDKSIFEIGLNYLHPNLYKFKTNEGNDVEISNLGGEISYKLFTKKKADGSGFYAKATGELTNLSIKTKKDLTKEVGKIGGVSMTCSACGILTVETDPNKLIFIPSLTIGYQKKINKRLYTNIEIGAQYIKLAEVIWSTNIGQDYPPFIQEEIDNVISDINEIRNDIINIIPTAKITLSYKL